MTGPLPPTPTAPPAASDPDMLRRMMDAAARGMGGKDAPKATEKLRGGPPAAERKLIQQLEGLGMRVVGAHSTDAELEDWFKALEREHKPYLDDSYREWKAHLHYEAGDQFLAWHRERRTWIPRRTLPWRVRSKYNVIAKAVSIRAQRLTDNKPTVTVQAKTAEQSDVERAEYKETLFWYLWTRCDVFEKWRLARRWAIRCGKGFLRVAWDPYAGQKRPATKKRVETTTVTVPVLGPDGAPQLGPDGQPIEQTEEVVVGVREFYVDQDGQELGPVLKEVEDPATGRRVEEAAEIPEDTAYVCDGEADVQVRSPFNVTWDRSVDAIHESPWICDTTIQTATEVLAAWPKAYERLRDAEQASDDDLALAQEGLVMRPSNYEVNGPSVDRSRRAPQGNQKVTVRYRVSEVWIYPRNAVWAKLWGDRGARLVFAGGRLIAKQPLPDWALDCPNWIELSDLPDPGNHYNKSILRDLLPLQDDLNRSRSMRAERAAMLSRLILWAPQNNGINVRALTGMSGVMVTTRARDQKPEPIDLNTGDDGSAAFEASTLAALADLGNMNEASSGKLPSAGLAAKTVYALQYADEQSVAEVSNAQDAALKRLAESLDAVTRYEYRSARKVEIVGEDRAFMVERDITPADLKVDVDYTFAPGSMLSRNKEAVKNEIMTLLDAKLIDPTTAKKYLPSAVPDVFRASYDAQVAKARRRLQQLSKLPPGAQLPAPDPWDDAPTQAAVFQEYLLTTRYEFLADHQKQAIVGYWEALHQRIMAAQAAAQAPVGQPPAPGGGGSQPPAPLPPPSGMSPIPGADELEAAATAAQEPPDGFMQPRQ